MLWFASLWLLVRVFGRMPPRILIACGDACAALLWYLSPGTRRVTLDHMRHALGPLSGRREQVRAAKGGVRSVGR